MKYRSFQFMVRVMNLRLGNPPCCARSFGGAGRDYTQSGGRRRRSVRGFSSDQGGAITPLMLSIFLGLVL
ncbi:MAG: hypothetical protein AAFV86_20745, partial [Pseudomonadota bacterium]